MTQDPIKLILETEAKGREDIETLKKDLSTQLDKSSINFEKKLIIVKEESENELEENLDSLKSDAKKAYMNEFNKYSENASKISSINTENKTDEIVSDFFNKIAS